MEYHLTTFRVPQVVSIPQFENPWVKAFWEGRDVIQDNLHTGQPQVENKTVQLLAFLSDGGRQWTARELTAEVGVCHKTVIHIVHDILGYRKLSTLWIPNEISEVQQWHRYAVAQALLDRYQREGDDFHGRIVAMDETWARSYEPHLIRQSNEWKHPGSPRRRKVRPTQCAVKVMSLWRMILME